MESSSALFTNGIIVAHKSNWRSDGDDGARHLLLQMTEGCFWKKILNDFDDYLDDDGCCYYYR